MSYGLPVVATTPSIEGMHLVPEQDVLVADDAKGFADAIVRLYHDEALWQRLAEGGRENIRRHFSRDVARSAITAPVSRSPRGIRRARHVATRSLATAPRNTRSRQWRGRAFARAPRTWSAGATRDAARSRPRCSASSGSAPKRCQHLLGVVLPIGRRVQVPAGRKPLRERVHERRREEPALVMALLRPRIGEEHVHAGERAAAQSCAPRPRPRRGGSRARCEGPAPRPCASNAPTPGACTSMPRKSCSGRAAAISAVVSPMPKPISRMTGARRPNTRAKSIARGANSMP